MSKLVDKERLAKLAKALDDRAKNYVADEAVLRVAADEALQAAIDAINNGESGILALAKAYADQQDTTDKEAQALVDQGLDNRLKAIEAKFGDGEGTVEDMIKAVEDALDAHKTAQATKDGEQDAAIQAAQKAADDEKVRAEAAEKGLADRLDVIEGEAEGSIKKAVAALKEIHDGEMDAIEGRATALEEVVGKAATETDAATGLVLKAAQNAQAISNEAARAAEEEGKLAQAIANEKAAQKLVNEGFEGRIAANEAFVAAQPAIDQEQDRRLGELEAKFAGNESVDNKIANALQAAKDYADDKDEAMDLRMDVVEEFKNNHSHADIEADIARLDGAVDVEGSVKQQIKAAIDQEVIDRNAAVKVVADELDNQKNVNVEGSLAAQIKAEKDRMDAFMNANAVKEGAVDTLKEIQDYIDSHGEVANQMVQNIAANKAAIGEASVPADENGEGAVAATGLHKKIEDEAARAKAEEADIRADFAAADATNLQAAKDYADGLDQAMDLRVDALEAFKEAHDHSVMEQGIADNKAAIEAEVGKEGVQGNRDKAIAAALEAYSTTEEVKAILGNVVNSLALTMENNQVVLKLGGVDGIALTSVELDLVTDEDINAIINGLDEEQGE